METEDLKVIDKKAVFKNIVCSNCRRFLNVSPIYCIEINNEVQKICGRCTQVVNNFSGKKYRQQTYEDLAECLTYPCSNKQYGCEAVFPWQNVTAHETACKFQYISCIFSSSELRMETECTWVGNMKNLDEHIKTMHKDFIMSQSQIHLDFESITKNKIFFTYVRKKLITIIITFEKQRKYYCLLMLNGNDMDGQCYQYQLELYASGKKDKSIILRKIKVEPFGSVEKYFKDHNRLLEIDLDQIENILGTSGKITGCFGIVKKNKKVIVDITGQDESVVKERPLSLDESLLQELECPVCNQYMVAKIYICHAGHSICSSCKDKVASCPICRSEFSKTRNYTLEKLTSKVHYPCRNREIGCNFVTTADKIRNHEVVCNLTDIHCLLGCGYKSLRPNMYNHILEKHPHQLHPLDVNLKQDLSEKKYSHYVLHSNGELFRFSLSLNNEYKFNIQHWGTIDETPKYRYQLEFLDPKSTNRSLSLSFFCQALTENPEHAYKTATVLQWDLLKPFYNLRYINYKISVFKV